MNKKLILFLLIFCIGVPCWAANTWTLNTFDQSVIQDTLDNVASAGDTIQLPDGNASWSGTIYVRKAVTIQGGGTNKTFITYGEPPFEVSTSGVRITGFWMHATTMEGSIGIYFTGPNGINNNPSTVIANRLRGNRVDNCFFWHCRGPVYFNYESMDAVVDHCTFLNNNGAINFRGDGSDTSWLPPGGPGTTNAVYIEDCWIIYTETGPEGGYSQAWGTAISSVYGMRVVVRNTHFLETRGMAGNGGYQFFETHGNQGYPVDGQRSYRGSQYVEIYGCDFNSVLGGQMMYLRGGLIMLYSNTFNHTDATIHITEEERPDMTDPRPTQYIYDSWPAMDNITNSYFWANTFGGQPLQWGVNTRFGSDTWDPILIANGRDYWLEAPGATNGLPMGVYQNYLANRTPYPHPLVGPPILPSAPILSYSPSSVSWETNSGGVCLQTVTLTNIGVSNLVGVATVSGGGGMVTLTGSGVNYNLTTNASTNFTIRYAPTDSNRHTGVVNLTCVTGNRTIAFDGWTPAFVVWPLGDSLTSGISAPTNVPGGYRIIVYNTLTNLGTNLIFIGSHTDNPATGLAYPNHDGVGGECITNNYTSGGGMNAGLIDDFQSWLLNKRTPNAVLLEIGLNDFRLMSSGGYDARLLATNYIKFFLTNLTTRLPNALVYVLGANGWTNAWSSDMDTYYATKLSAICTEFQSIGRHVYYVDFRGVLVTGSDILAYHIGLPDQDTVHLTAAGYAKKAGTWLNALTNAPVPPGLAPTITVNPASQSKTAGSSVTFTVSATGTAPFTYQWKHAGTNLPGATVSALTIIGLTSAHAGNYVVTVSNGYGSATSSTAVLTVNYYPSIVDWFPHDGTNLTVGDNLTMTVTATGTSIGYRWRKDGSLIPGATTTALPIVNAQIPDSGQYQPEITNLLGSVIGEAIVVTVTAPGISPSITVQPLPSSIGIVGSMIQIIVGAEGTPPLSYQWLRNGVPVASKTDAVCVLTKITSANDGSYRCHVSNPYGDTFSDPCVVTTAYPPSFDSYNPAGSANVLVGANVTMTAHATGTAPIDYGWYRGPTWLANGDTLTLNNVQLATAGTYTPWATNVARESMMVATSFNG